jgi:hypothetical protein
LIEPRQHLNDPDEKDAPVVQGGLGSDASAPSHVQDGRAFSRAATRDRVEVTLLFRAAAACRFRNVEDHGSTGTVELITDRAIGLAHHRDRDFLECHGRSVHVEPFSIEEYGNLSVRERSTSVFRKRRRDLPGPAAMPALGSRVAMAQPQKVSWVAWLVNVNVNVNVNVPERF